MKFPIIFAGHGGMINEEYVTAPGKMYEFEDGFTIYEGVVNRKICEHVVNELQCVEAPHFYYDTPFDSPLETQLQIAEHLSDEFGEGFVIDIHNNAGGGSGSEIYTSPGQTASDPIATNIFNAIKEEMGSGWRMRAEYNPDNDPDKEEEFYMLMETHLPSVLIECGFMDTRSDAELITSNNGQRKFGRAIAKGILKSINS